MKTILLVLAVLVCATTAFAQGPFNDVPTDHWAYDAVNQLQKDGIVIGYPDGTFSGKRAITRYEFATALARVITLIPAVAAVDLSGLAKTTDIPSIAGLANASDIPDISGLASKADLDRVSKLVDEFKDELAALGVDVDALKKDIAALDARVCILEAEMARVKITGVANIFAMTEVHRSGRVDAIDLDNRPIPVLASLADNISLVRDMDLNVVGRVSDNTTAIATINYGSYLNYLGSVDAYTGVARPTTKGGNSTVRDSLSDNFFPYYLYIETAINKGAVTVGRFPLQFTPYTLKKIDVDSYTSILKTDDGNYPVDGIKTVCGAFGADITLFAVKNDLNDYLANGLTGQAIPFLHQLATGPGVGGLAPVTQTAGARATFAVPYGGNMGLTYYQTYAQGGVDYDQARVFGADISILIGNRFNFVGNWTQSDTLAADKAPAGVGDVDYLNIAWDGKIVTGFGKVGLTAGYKSIGRNFAAAGSWDKIGRFTNPVNVKGPYADISYPILSNLKLNLNGEFLTWKDPAVIGGWGAKNDKIVQGEAGLSWGFSAKNALSLGYEMVEFQHDIGGASDAKETYLTLGLSHSMSPNAGVNIGYQLINYDNAGAGPYGDDYRGGLGVVQFGVSF
ncbi:MAG: S-layer homology domain-containing protein [Armatimonadetes bacterium]|nr:S-layer homology domain-containing protein [Armatimonadota bacterium]